MAAGTALAVLSVVGTGASIYQGQQTAEENKKAGRIRQSMASIKEARARRKQAREAAIARGQIANSAAQTGRADSSSAVGSTAFVDGQQNTNLTQISQDRAFSRDISSVNQRAADYQGRASTYGAVSRVSAQFAGDKGFEELGGKISNIFK